MIRGFLAPLACVVVLGTGGHARADDTQPWVVGVSAEQKANAKRLLDAGNALFLERDYAGALERYRAAVAAWDHPAIRFNIVRCLIQLDRSIEAYDNLQAALKYGAAPLEEAVYNEALAYQKLLANQIGEVELACSQAGVTVTFDGQRIAACPTKELRRVGAGTHQVIATGDGLVARTIEVAVAGGKHQELAIELVPFAKAGVVTHRWSTWVPWAVVAGGAVVLGVGALVNYQATHDYATYDTGIGEACANLGCGSANPTPPELVDLEHRASNERAVAIGMVSVGIAAVGTGAALVYLNRGRLTFPSSREHVTPVVTPVAGGAAVSLVGRF